MDFDFFFFYNCRLRATRVLMNFFTSADLLFVHLFVTDIA